MDAVDILIYLQKKKKYIIGMPILAGVLAFFIAQILPPIFYTEIRIRIDDPTQSTSISSMKLKGGSISDYFKSKGDANSEDFFLELLEGRDNMVKAIHKFKLDSIYKKKSIDLTIVKFSKDLTVSMEDNGIIVCGYQSKSKERAVDLVRFMVKNANDRYMALEHERMLENTSFLRQKHKEISDSLDHLQNALAEYHRKNKIIDPEEQIRISLEALAGYEQQINNISIEESYFAKTSGDDSPAKIKAGYKVAAIGQELKKLRGNYTDSYKPSESSVFLNSDWAIQRYLDVERIKLNVKLVSGLLEVISSELALAESQSSRTQAVIQVVQDAYVPDWKLKPKRAVWALGGFIISFVFCLAFVLFAGIMDGKVGNGTPFQSQMRRFIESFKS